MNRVRRTEADTEVGHTKLEVGTMAATKQWTVDIYLSEKAADDFEGGATVRTHAEARLRTGDATALRGVGDARKHPADPDVPEIGDELAAARALSDLAHQLLHVAAADIESTAGNSSARPTPAWIDPAQ